MFTHSYIIDSSVALESKHINNQEKLILFFKKLVLEEKLDDDTNDDMSRMGRIRIYKSDFHIRDIARACLHKSLNLKRLGSVSRQHHHPRISNSNSTMKMMKKEDIARGLGIGSHATKAEVVVSNKVLPISEGENEGCVGDEKVKSEKQRRTISRMKELLRWAAAAKSEKAGKFLGRKVLYFRNKSALKTVPDDDQMSNESPKISFRWEVESCSTTTSSTYSMTSSRNRSSRRGNWITTDDEFVVLEL